MTDQELIGQALASHPQALSQIEQWIREVVEHPLWGWPDPPEALVRQVQYRLAKQFGQRRFQPSHDLRTHVYKLAEQGCIEWIRRQYRPPDIDSLRQELELEAIVAHWPNMPVDERQLFFHIFHALSDECRRLWRFIFLDGQSYLEVAGQLREDEKSVRSRFRQCMHQTIELYRRLTCPADEPSQIRP